MIFKRINRSSPEQVFAVFQANVANIAADDVVGLEMAAASVNGVLINQAATAILANAGVVGLADAAIANGDYGLVQIYGYRSTSRVLASNADQAIGVNLTPASAQDYLTSYASTIGLVPSFVLLESATSSNGTVTRKVFIRAMVALLALACTF